MGLTSLLSSCSGAEEGVSGAEEDFSGVETLLTAEVFSEDTTISLLRLLKGSSFSEDAVLTSDVPASEILVSEAVLTVDVALLSSWDEAEELTEDCSGEVRSGRVVSVEINVFSDWAEEVRWGIESSGCCVFKPLQAVMVRSREDNNKISAFFFMF